jgi:hypothetical protein
LQEASSPWSKSKLVKNIHQGLNRFSGAKQAAEKGGIFGKLTEDIPPGLERN